MARPQLAQRCPACKGSGKALVKRTIGRLALRPRTKVFSERCPKCRGVGYV